MQKLSDLGALYAGLASYGGFWFSWPKVERRAITQAEKLALFLIGVAGLLGTLIVLFNLDAQ